ncbi:MAG TPA: NAD(P)H-binding protein [Polyangiales bacterium]
MLVVMGASGRTGSKVVRGLLAAGQATCGIVRGAAAARALQSCGATAAQLSLTDGAALTRALRGARGAYVLLPEDLQAPEFHAQRRRVTDALAEAVRASAVPHVVFLSAAIVRAADAECRLAAELRHAEAALAASGCTLTVLRASYFQENVLSALTPARSHGVYPSFFASADYAFSTVATRDVAELAVRCLLEPQPGVVDVQGPSYSARDIAAQLGKALGRELRLVDVPEPVQLDMLGQAGLPDEFARALVALFACYRPGRLPAAGERVWRGSTPLETTLRELLAAEVRP